MCLGPGKPKSFLFTNVLPEELGFSWEEPEEPNGEIICYEVRRNLLIIVSLKSSGGLISRILYFYIFKAFKLFILACEKQEKDRGNSIDIVATSVKKCLA